MYLAVNGKQGLRQVAELCLHKAHYLAEKIEQIPGCSLAFQAPFFLEFVVRTPEPPGQINHRLLQYGIIGGLDLGRFNSAWEGLLLLSVTEKRTRREMDTFVAVMGGKS